MWGWKCPCTEISNTKPRAPNAARAVLLFFFLHTGFLNQFTRKGLSSVVLSYSSAYFSCIRVPLSFRLPLEVQTVFSSFWLREHLKTASRWQPGSDQCDSSFLYPNQPKIWRMGPKSLLHPGANLPQPGWSGAALVPQGTPSMCWDPRCGNSAVQQRHLVAALQTTHTQRTRQPGGGCLPWWQSSHLFPDSCFKV